MDGDGGGRVGRRSRKSLNLDCASEMTLAPPRKTSFRRLEHCLKAAKKRRGEERRWKGGGRERAREMAREKRDGGGRIDEWRGEGAGGRDGRTILVYACCVDFYNIVLFSFLRTKESMERLGRIL